MTTAHDHRKLGRELGVFDTDPLIGADRRTGGYPSQERKPMMPRPGVVAA